LIHSDAEVELRTSASELEVRGSRRESVLSEFLQSYLGNRSME